MTLAELRRIAEAATPGPWEWKRPSEEDWPQHDQSLVTTWKENDGHPAIVLHGWGYDASGIEADPQDRLFIETFDPERVLELLDQIEQLQAVVRDQHDECVYQTRLAAVEKLHEGVPSSDPVADGLCNECYVPSPCPTIKAVRGE